jgi:hypothetical protein
MQGTFIGRPRAQMKIMKLKSCEENSRRVVINQADKKNRKQLVLVE